MKWCNIEQPQSFFGFRIDNRERDARVLVARRAPLNPSTVPSGQRVIVAHNHPSGDPTSSAEYVAIAQRLRQALAIVGIELLDAIVIGEAGQYSSQRERGEL